MATIKDVAKLAGVSIATVSNIINGKASMNGAAYERVKKAIEELGYRPNYMAQNIRGNKARFVGVLLPSLDAPYQDVYRGILQVLEKKSITCILKLTDNNAELETEMLNLLTDLGVFGLILVPVETGNIAKYRVFERKKVPLILVERDLKGIDCSKILFGNRGLVAGELEDLQSRYAREEMVLVRSSAPYSSEEECQAAYVEALGDGADVIRVPPEKNVEMFHLYNALLERAGKRRCVIATTMQYARVVSDVAMLLKLELDIRALGSDEWCIANPYRCITPIQRNTLYAGMQAAQLMLNTAEHKYQTVEQTICLKPKVFRAHEPVMGVEPARRALRVLALECDTIHVLERLSRSAKLHLGVELSFDTYGYGELQSRLYQQVRGESGEYDIVMIDMPWLAYLRDKEFLVDIDRRVGQRLRDKYPREIGNAFFKYMDSRYIVPLVSGIQAIYYRADCFGDAELRAAFEKKYGFALRVPKSWAEFNTVCQFFTREYNPASPFAYGTSLSVRDNNEIIHEFLPRQWSFAGRIIDESGRVALDQDSNVRALNNIRESYRYSAGVQSIETLDEEFFGLLLEGEIPLVHGFTNHYHPERRSGRDLSRVISIAPMPQGRSVLGGWALGVSRGSTRIDQSCAYLSWLLTDSISIANMRMNGCIPTLAVHRNADLRNQYSWLGFMNEAFTKGGNREVILDRYGKQIAAERIDDILARAIQAALRTDTDSWELMSRAQEEMEKLIGR